MIVEDQPPWAPHLRSRARVRNLAKRHFVDPSLAVAALAATPQRIISDLKYFGFLFESPVTRDLRIYAQHSDAQVLQYRHSYDREVDAIVKALTAAGQPLRSSSAAGSSMKAPTT